jgi:peptide/nickel transport system permease protein
MGLLAYLGSRLLLYAGVILFGVTFVFFVPRALPTDPVEAMIGKVTSQGQYMEQAQVDALRASLTDAFGLSGSLGGQYWRFLKRVFVTGDFGPSLAMYPTPVSKLVADALPWTFGLLLTAVLIAWMVGNVAGLLVGARPRWAISRILEGLAICVYPVPYYVLALVLSIFFSYIWPIFPLTMAVQGAPWTLEFVGSVVWNSFLPGCSIVLVTFGWWLLSMKALSSSILEEDFVAYGELKGLGQRRLLVSYVFRNALLPQVTFLALQIGLMFNGSIVMEILFQYPGVGSLIYSAVIQGDYNLLMGTIAISIVAVATATLVVDLVYPLLDPRIRYK